MGQLSDFHLHDRFLGIPFRHKHGYHFHHREPASFRNSLVTENVPEYNDSKQFEGCEKRRVFHTENIYVEIFVKIIPEKAPFYVLTVTRGNFQRIHCNLFKWFLVYYLLHWHLGNHYFCFQLLVAFKTWWYYPHFQSITWHSQASFLWDLVMARISTIILKYQHRTAQSSEASLPFSQMCKSNYAKQPSPLGDLAQIRTKERFS